MSMPPLLCCKVVAKLILCPTVMIKIHNTSHNIQIKKEHVCKRPPITNLWNSGKSWRAGKPKLWAFSPAHLSHCPFSQQTEWACALFHWSKEARPVAGPGVQTPGEALLPSVGYRRSDPPLTQSKLPPEAPDRESEGQGHHFTSSGWGSLPTPS